MANHPQVGLGDAEEIGQTGAGLLLIERHDDHRAFALFQILHAARELCMVQLGQRRRGRRQQIPAKLLEQAFLPLRAAALVETWRSAAANSQREAS